MARRRRFAAAPSNGTAPALRGGASFSGTAPALRSGASFSGTAPALCPTRPTPATCGGASFSGTAPALRGGATTVDRPIRALAPFRLADVSCAT
jgi:hypothetical protein